MITHLSLEMLQSMTVFLLVLTIMKGRWMMELGGGGRFACCSVCLFLWTRFLKAICCKTRSKTSWNSNSCKELSVALQHSWIYLCFFFLNANFFFYIVTILSYHFACATCIYRDSMRRTSVYYWFIMIQHHKKRQNADKSNLKRPISSWGIYKESSAALMHNYHYKDYNCSPPLITQVPALKSNLQYELLKLWLFLLNPLQPPLSLHLQLK